MSKTDRIEALEYEVDALRVTCQKLERALGKLELAMSPPTPAKPQTFAEMARSELYRKWDWLLGAVGPRG